MRTLSKTLKVTVVLAGFIFMFMLSTAVLPMLVAQNGATISGHVTDSSSGQGVEGVTITFVGTPPGTETTDSDGYYSHDVGYGWEGTVTPSYLCYSFVPVSATIQVEEGDEVQDFSATYECGTIVVEKQTEPPDGEGFSFTHNLGGGGTFELDDNLTETIPNVPAATYTVTETVPIGWELTGLTCDDPDSGSSTDPISGTATIDLDAGETITCTFTNSEWGTVVIEKQTEPPGSPGFGFTHNLDGGGGFDLNDGDTFAFDLPAATYTVSETVPIGWELTNFECETEDLGDTSILSGTVATIDLDAGETITCTFTNSEWGTIALHKVTDPPDGATFSFTSNIFGAWSFTLDHCTTLSFTIPAATYTVTETLPFGWSLSNFDCETDDEGDTSSLSGNQLTVDLDPGENITCTLTNSEWGTIFLHKVTDPPGGAGFDFLSDFDFLRPPWFPLDPDFSLDHCDTLSFTIPAFTYTFTETLPVDAEWYLAGVECETDDLNDTSSLSGNPITIDLDAGETISCTINNSQYGTIVLRKRTTPPGGSGFEFTNPFGIGPPSFSIGDGDTLTIYPVPAGTFSVTETDPIPFGFDLIDVNCEDPDGGSSIDLDARTATIDLDAGETITCTFTNAELGTIVVEKQTDPDGVSGIFTFSDDIGTPPTFSLSDGQTQRFTDVVSGTYAITETNPAPAFDLTDVTCSDGSLGNVGTGVATVSLQPGEVVTCTFTNTLRAHIFIDKVTDPGSDSTSFDFTLTDGPSNLNESFSLTDAATPHDSGAILPGSGYSAAETVPAGWDLTTSCSDGSPVNNIDLNPGEVVTCTFTNTAQPGSITVVKKVVGEAPDTEWQFTGDLGDFSISQDGGQKDFPGQSPGGYTINETTKAGYAVEVNCNTGESGTDSVTVDLGLAETITCTFTNTKMAIEDPKTVELVVDADNTGQPSPGDTLRYTALISNTGKATVNDVEFLDTIPNHTTYQPGSMTLQINGGPVKSLTDANDSPDEGFFNTGSNRVEVTIGTLDVGEKAIITFDVQINAAVPPGTLVANQGMVIGTNFPFDPTDDPETDPPDDPTTTTVAAGPPAPIPVGGIIVPVGKMRLLAPWLGLAAVVSLVALTVALARRHRG